MSLVFTQTKPGITTGYIDQIVHEFIVNSGAYPSPLCYPSEDGVGPFPKSICTSVNEVSAQQFAN